MHVVHCSNRHKVWSVNDGLSGNLLETSGNRFLQVSEFFITIIKKNTNKKSGNLPETSSAEVSGGFPDNPSLTDHTVYQYQQWAEVSWVNYPA